MDGVLQLLSAAVVFQGVQRHDVAFLVDFEDQTFEEKVAQNLVLLDVLLPANSEEVEEKELEDQRQVVFQARLHDLKKFFEKTYRVSLILNLEELLLILLLRHVLQAAETFVHVQKTAAFEQLLILGAVVFGNLLARVAFCQRVVGAALFLEQQEVLIDDDTVRYFREEFPEEGVNRGGFHQTLQHHDCDFAVVVHIFKALGILQLILEEEEDEVEEVGGLFARTRGVHEAGVEVKDDEIHEVLGHLARLQHGMHQGLGRMLEESNDLPKRRLHFLENLRLVAQDIGVEEAL